jgi:hypothetical protein
MKKHFYRSLIFLTLCLTLMGCGGGSSGSGLSTTPIAVSSAVTVANSQTQMQLLVATLTQCPYGGSVIQLFKDANGDGIYDTGDSVVSETPVCNGATGSTGATGAQGVGAGILVSAASVGSCPAGGSSIITFQDLNNNGTLDSGETITSTSTICNGIAGANGTNGTSAFLTTSSASVAQCANGGVVYTTHVDGETPVANIVCNGTNGSSGTNASFLSGPVGTAVTGQVYTSCHHDYMYLPDETNGNRGWLIFRHQANGTADQGAGSTGFNVWNVDISDFDLVSEDNSVTYCQLHWDANAKILNYTVITNEDGHQGETGTINLNP